MSLGFQWEVFVVKIVGLMIDERSTVQRTARRGPFLTVARARERIAMYINGYSNITHRAQKERQGRSEQTPRVSIYRFRQLI